MQIIKIRDKLSIDIDIDIDIEFIKGRGSLRRSIKHYDPNFEVPEFRKVKHMVVRHGVAGY